MKTLYLTDSSANIYVDPDTNDTGYLTTEDRYDIRNVFYIEEPMHIVYKCGERMEEIDAKKGDILVQFYSNRYNKYVLDTIKTKQWSANIKNRHKLEQLEKEEWAKNKASVSDCENCDLRCGDVPCTADTTVSNELPQPKKASASAAKKIKDAIKKVAKKVKKS